MAVSIFQVMHKPEKVVIEGDKVVSFTKQHLGKDRNEQVHSNMAFKMMCGPHSTYY